MTKNPGDVNSVVNLSKLKVNQDHISVLNKGMNFTTTASKTSLEHPYKYSIVYHAASMANVLHNITVKENAKSEENSDFSNASDSDEESGDMNDLIFCSNIKKAYTHPRIGINHQPPEGYIDEITSEAMTQLNTSNHQNLRPNERKALEELRQAVKNEVISVVESDKTGRVYILDPEDKKMLMEKELNGASYLPATDNRDIMLEKVKTLVIKLWEIGAISKENLRAISGVKSETMNTTKVYAEFYKKQNFCSSVILLKDHKSNDLPTKETIRSIPVRLVIANSSSPTSKLAGWLSLVIKSFLKKIDSEILKDTVNLLQKIEDDSLVTQLNSRKKTNFHATIDVEKLYPSLNSNLIKDAFHWFFNKYTDLHINVINLLVEAILLVIKEEIFIHDKSLYKIAVGIPTGSKVSVEIANITLMYVIDQVNSNLQQHQPPFKRIYRFIDDIYLLIQGSKSRCNSFLEKFMQEFTNFSGLNLTSDGLLTVETNVNFLDVNLKFSNGKWVTSEYVKKLKPLKYINYKSNQPKQVMKSIIKGEATRVRRLCSSDMEYIKSLQRIGIRCINSDYPQKMVWKILRQAKQWKRDINYKPQERDDVEKQTVALVLPYHKETFEKTKEKTKEEFNKLNLNHIEKIKLVVGFRNTTSIKQLLQPPKETINEAPACVRKHLCPICHNQNPHSSKLTCGDSGIYKITCKNCNQCYVGKTTTPFYQRILQHRSSKINDDPRSTNTSDDDQKAVNQHLYQCYGERISTKDWKDKVNITFEYDRQKCNDKILGCLAYQEDRIAYKDKASINKQNLIVYKANP